MKQKKVALVTGGNRGIGFEVCRQLAKLDFEVILTCRDEEKGRAALDKLKSEGLDVRFHPLDVTQESSRSALEKFVREKMGRLDVLVNNAGIFPDAKFGQPSDPFLTSLETMKTALETNVLGVFALTQRLAPIMRDGGYGRIVNVSSEMGQLASMTGDYPAYRLSKCALNALTKIFADTLQGANVLVNSIHPGWVQTDMGGANAPRKPEKGAETIVYCATLPDGGPTGGFFKDLRPIPW